MEVCDYKVGEEFEVFRLLCFHGRLEREVFAEDGDVLHLFEDGAHSLTALGSPGTILDDGDGAVLPTVGLEVMQQVFDWGEDACVVGRRGKYKMAVAEALGHELADIGVAGVIHGDAFHAMLSQDGCHLLGGRGSVAVDAAVDDQHAFLLGTVAAPSVMLPDKPT